MNTLCSITATALSAVLLGLLLPLVSFGQTWTQTTAPVTNWTAVASSADGSRLVAVAGAPPELFYEPSEPGLIYISTNSGAAWTVTPAPGLFWFSVACSADGTRIFAAARGDGIYASSDVGASWTKTSAPASNWTSVACSADGTRLVAVAAGTLHTYSAREGPIFISTNSGTTWDITSAPLGRWISVAASADGRTFIAVQPFGIGISKDTGLTWMETNAPGYTATVASSAAGDRVVVGACDPFHFPYGGALSVSTNCGVSWNEPHASTIGRGCVASSVEGVRLIGASGVKGNPFGPDGDTIRRSANAGATWTEMDAPRLPWIAVASSADGTRLVAAAKDGGIYTAQSVADTKLSITTASTDIAGPNIELSWVVPADPLVLQENISLSTAGWINVTEKPSLDLSKLRYHLGISPEGPARFYRLRSLLP